MLLSSLEVDAFRITFVSTFMLVGAEKCATGGVLGGFSRISIILASLFMVAVNLPAGILLVSYSMLYSPF